MIEKQMNNEQNQLICPECKNNVDTGKFANIKEGMIVECNHCGMTLLVKSIQNGVISTDIVDEGK